MLRDLGYLYDMLHEARIALSFASNKDLPLFRETPFPKRAAQPT